LIIVIPVKIRRTAQNKTCLAVTPFAPSSKDLALPCIILLAAPRLGGRVKEMLKKEGRINKCNNIEQ
jgi:hypothetical protein